MAYKHKTDRRLTEEHKQAIRDSRLRGVPRPKEVREKISARLTGKKKTEQHRENIRQALLDYHAKVKEALALMERQVS